MVRDTVRMTDEMRDLLKAARHHSHLTQPEAAAKAGVSAAWWAQLETDVKDTAATDTLVSMLFAVQAPARAVMKIDQHVAQELEKRYDWFGGETF